MPEEMKYGTTRSFGRVILFSFITFGIFYLVYWLRVFQDLDEHFQKAKDTERKASPTTNNSGTMFLLLFLFPIYPLYKKYQLLNDHIDTSPKKSEPNCPTGIMALFSFFFGFCTIGIWPLLNERKWQKAMNAHILKHEKTSK